MNVTVWPASSVTVTGKLAGDGVACDADGTELAAGECSGVTAGVGAVADVGLVAGVVVGDWDVGAAAVAQPSRIVVSRMIDTSSVESREDNHIGRTYPQRPSGKCGASAFSSRLFE